MWELNDPVATQPRNLEAIEQKGSRMQHQLKVKGLETYYRVLDASVLESWGNWRPVTRDNGEGSGISKTKTLPFTFPFCSIYRPVAWYWAHSGWTTHPSFTNLSSTVLHSSARWPLLKAKWHITINDHKHLFHTLQKSSTERFEIWFW